MSVPLDPEHLTPTASLNRVRLADLPGIGLPPDVCGRRAGEILSTPALAGEIERAAPALGLTADELADPRALPRHFSRCFMDADPAVRATAEQIARRWGRHLAALLLVVPRGDPANRAARPEWDDSYWAYLAAVRTVYLGGGQVSGPLGPLMVDEANAVLRASGQDRCMVHLAAHPAILPLIGAARTVPAGIDAAIVLDFGNTAVKRGVARYREGALAALRLLPARPSGLSAGYGPPPADGTAPAWTGDMAALLAETWQEAAASGPPPTTAAVAVAGYVRDNHPLPTEAPYLQTGPRIPNLGAWLGAEMGRRVGRPLAVTVLHDGTAAARACAGAPHSAVIMLGTWLGVGFPPPAAACRPLAPDLVVIPAE